MIVREVVAEGVRVKLRPAAEVVVVVKDWLRAASEAGLMAIERRVT